MIISRYLINYVGTYTTLLDFLKLREEAKKNWQRVGYSLLYLGFWDHQLLKRSIREFYKDL